ncbi:hypothetical protein [Acanthamoeba castellanii mimivirus]|uniref:Uncharacterized protein R314 n=7 Tax=Mimivirus TaxID=315393 RepID=YR314_MIMIV|nr:hypothetical protein MIMI_gp0343 [Acanthamoeba polyphaga mimivirus]Q5UQ01.1 RecName: Full=Uncharacterized protein R314 [Acanthamoeba polyphaga mimivirus]ALR83894.1 hypothetical protein [Niemeyer virus]AMZ02761.1 hypothetical protein [Mimivirus Bombay]QTF49226.1 hypothetical protein [Mimivirus reunion]WMV61669.1 hypothetical protein qu_334 [Mimivirus sp.]BAV61414.1 hypothetical protein [Acanthamoeba castellanii mimivirus]
MSIVNSELDKSISTHIINNTNIIMAHYCNGSCAHNAYHTGYDKGMAVGMLAQQLLQSACPPVGVRTSYDLWGTVQPVRRYTCSYQCPYAGGAECSMCFARRVNPSGSPTYNPGQNSAPTILLSLAPGTSLSIGGIKYI